MKKELDNYLVEKYPKIFRDRSKGIKESLMCFGFDHGDGWFWLLDNLCDSIQSYIDINNQFGGNIQQVVATQVKEKYGALNFYYVGGDDHIDGMVTFAANMSQNICEECGSNNNIGKTSGWIRYLCKDCYEIYKKEKLDNGFTPNEWEEVKLPLELSRKLKLNKLDHIS